MTYLSGGVEYLTGDEFKVYAAVKALRTGPRKSTGNNSQIAYVTKLSRATVGHLATGLRARGYLTNVSKGASYHWRTTGKPVRVAPDTAEVPEKVTAYFERRREEGQRKQSPVITQTWIPGQAFQDVAYIPVTYTALRRLREQGVEQVGISCYGRGPADFTIRELLADAELPLLGGSLIGSRRSAAR